MASIEGLKNRLQQWKPRISSTYVVFIGPKKSPITEDMLDENFSMVTVTQPDDPLLPKITHSKRQFRIAQQALATGRWDILVAVDRDGEPAGRVWQSFGSERDLANGLPRMKLAEDEVLMFDLFVSEKYRRTGVAMNMAHAFFGRYDPDVTTLRYAYGFIDSENAVSMFFHHAVGFQLLQTVNLIEIGPYIKWKIPFSDSPRFGPMSQRGRHTNRDRNLSGQPLMP